MKTNTLRTLLTVVGLLAVSTAAYAFWTAGGSGSGSAATGTSVALTANQTSVLTPMYPGDTAQTLSGNFDNPNSGPVYVGTVTVSIASVTKAAAAASGTCDASDYTLATPVMSVNAEVPAGTARGAWTGATLRFNNKTTTNQDACKNATVTLSYSIA